MAERLTIRACPHCGSLDTWPALLFGGPLPWVDHNDGGYVCRTCGKQAVPLDFDSLDDLKEYKKGIIGKTDETSEKEFLHIPIVPVDTIALFSIPKTNLSFVRRAEVVGIEYNGETIRRTNDRVPYLNYRRAVNGIQYNASEIMMMDLSGITTGRPNFEALKEIVRRRFDIWLDLGIRSIHDLFDSFAMEASRAIASTMTAPDISLFEEAYELSDRCVPCIYLFNDVIWSRTRAEPRKLENALGAFERIGFEEIGVIDLARLGTRSGVSHDLISRVEGRDSRIILGGGVVESDLDRIREAGLRGAFIDPFSSVISQLVQSEKTVPVEAIPGIDK